MSPNASRTLRISDGTPPEKRIPAILLVSRKARGMIAAGILFWTAAVALWLQQDLDKAVLVGQASLRHNSLAAKTASMLSVYGLAFCVLALLCLPALSFKIESLEEIRTLCPLILISFALAGSAGDLSKEIFVRPRPFQEYASESLSGNDR